MNQFDHAPINSIITDRRGSVERVPFWQGSRVDEAMELVGLAVYNVERDQSHFAWAVVSTCCIACRFKVNHDKLSLFDIFWRDWNKVD